MRIGIVGAEENHYVRELKRAAGETHAVELLPFADLEAEVDDDGCRVRCRERLLDDCDVLHLRTMAGGSLEQVVFRMDALGRAAAAGLPMVNPPRTIELAVDKFLTTGVLRRAGLPVPRTWTGQSTAGALAAFERFGRDAVVKPIFGSQGRGIFRLTDPDVAERTLQLLVSLGAILYLQEFVPHPGWDLRLLIVGDDCLAVRRSHPTDWRTNVCRGASAEPHAATAAEEDLARRAAWAVGASLAGVDLIPAADGRLLVLEVNAVPGWSGVAAARGVDVAALVLAHLVRSARRG